MKLDKSIAVLAMVASLVLAAGTAAAQDNYPADTTMAQENLSEYSLSTADTADLDGGNVSNVNLSSEQSTDQWAGVYGTADGSLVLGNGTDGSLLYSWNADADNVFASNGSVDWKNMENGRATTVDNYFGLADGSDNATNTFTTDEGGTPTIDSGDLSVTGNGTQTFESGETEAWTTVVLESNTSASSDTDETNLPVFAGIVDEGTNAFNGETADYQLLLPAQDEVTTSYNMYLSLS